MYKQRNLYDTAMAENSFSDFPNSLTLDPKNDFDNPSGSSKLAVKFSSFLLSSYSSIFSSQFAFHLYVILIYQNDHHTVRLLPAIKCLFKPKFRHQLLHNSDTSISAIQEENFEALKRFLIFAVGSCNVQSIANVF